MSNTQQIATDRIVTFWKCEHCNKRIEIDLSQLEEIPMCPCRENEFNEMTVLNTVTILPPVRIDYSKNITNTFVDDAERFD